MLAGWTPLVLMLATAWGGPAEEFGAERSQPRDAIESIRVENVFLVPSRQLDVPAREGGLITRLIVREGDHVRAGDLLGQLEEVTPQLVLRRADAELGRVRRESQNDLKLQIARKIEEVAGAELMRAEQSESRVKGSVTPTEFDRLRLTLERSRLETAQAQFEFELAAQQITLGELDKQLAEAAWERRRIISPADGVVVEVHREQGEWIEPGQTLLRLVTLDQMRAEGFVAAERAWQWEPNQQVAIRVAQEGSDLICQGRLAFISPEIHPVNGQVRFWAEIDNQAGRLRPGMRVIMELSRKNR
jgi:RND family efflux transporter MFP subunit